MRMHEAVLVIDGVPTAAIIRGTIDNEWAFDHRCIGGYRWIASRWRRVITVSPGAVVDATPGVEWRVYPGGTTPPMTIDAPDPDR